MCKRCGVFSNWHFLSIWFMVCAVGISFIKNMWGVFGIGFAFVAGMCSMYLLFSCDL
jgi:hypothetical protein